MNYNEISALFESSNARNLNSSQLTNEFIWTESFDSLLSLQNQIILGSRGSGKTALIKMLAHENLSKITDKYSKAKIVVDQREFIATYVPLRVEWVNSLNNFESDKEKYFIWSLNLSLCSRLLDTIKSCIDSYFHDEIAQLRCERIISKTISTFWFDNQVFNNFAYIRKELESVEFKKNLVFNKEAMGIELTKEEKEVGIAFHMTLFKPFEYATRAAQEHLNLSDNAKWIVCIDEAEFLYKSHHQILNTYMRSASDLVFKITTMPYRHHTLDTDVMANINVGHDLDYVYIDKLGTSDLNQQKADAVIQNFAENLFINRLKYFGQEIFSLETLVGRSILTQSTSDIANDEEVLYLINKHCNDDTKLRSSELYSNNKGSFDDAIGRKLRGILLLREEYHNKAGNASSMLYSGVEVISRCSDGNPRRLFRLFNHLLSGLKDGQKSIPNSSQSERLKSYSHRELEVIKFEKDGVKAFDFLNKVGGYFKDKCLIDKLGADIPQSFYINDNISDEHWGNIKTAVDLGLLYPYIKKDRNSKTLFPSKEGRFVLANCLAPNFNLLPRIGRGVSYNAIFQPDNTIFEREQLELFKYED
ncbi:hypothetical protein SIL08_02560 [Scandinavium sp. V105_16]|uniref:Uncharacterized protein n=1 Tax=Scandinavium lactucae TaxID=3095028 RepID=A0AAJ2VT94_9ENTR|nr:MULTISPECIES: hypothetical protein [unclassified Scandinavium]MDX6019172.1 hypothetical protein [Scandinavium sp. V105_16]MDX6030672.1 hypothetical protein [Scandinavium sp. V105_12]